MGNVLQFHNRTCQEADFDTEPTMTMEEISQVAEKFRKKFWEHPEDHSEGALALMELAEEIGRCGDTEFEYARLDRCIENTMKKVGKINLPGEEFNHKWVEGHQSK